MGLNLDNESEREVFKIAAEQAYSQNPAQTIGNGYNLLFQTPTVKIYMRGDTVIVAVRGTKINDADDIAADVSIPLNNLQNSARFKKDLSFVQSIHQYYPNATFLGAGHSLGGAIIDLFLEMGLLNSAVTYNPAVQNAHQSSANTRIYNNNDPLYLVSQHFLKQKPTVKQSRTWASFLSPFASSLNAHRLNQIKGAGL